MKVRHGEAMIALDVKTLPAIGNRPGQDGLPRTIVVTRIALRRLSAVLRGISVTHAQPPLPGTGERHFQSE